MTTPIDITELRLRLVRGGYIPLPLYGKTPPVFGKNNKTKGLSKWEKLDNVTPKMTKMWARTWPDAVNTGALTRLMPTLDIDILNEEAAGAIEAHVRERYEGHGQVLSRIGKPPKRAIPFKTDKPFEKIAANVMAANGTAEKIEFLASGQQVVVDGIHPDTEQPYRWHGGKLGDVLREELPHIDEEGARTLVGEIVELLIHDFGYKRAPERPRKRRKGNGGTQGDGANGGADDWQYLLDNIRAGRELHDSLRDLAAKLIASGMSPGAAVNFLRAQMEGSSTPRDARWQVRYQDIPRLVDSAEGLPKADKDLSVSITDFRAYMPMHSYIFTPTRELWPAASVNARVPPVFRANGKPMRATDWLDQNASVEQMTWAPGEPTLIRDKLIADGGWFKRSGSTVFNLYCPAVIVPRGGDVSRWLDLLGKVFPDEYDHIVKWFAHRKQRPHEKINHALVLGGKPGVGKDTILEPVKHAIGPWNFADVTPKQMLGRFNGHLKSIILRVSEARDLGDFDRYAFYDHTKAIIASPPDVLRIDEKHLREHYVPNLCGVVITSNHKADGIYLPADDRRHLVAWSRLTQGNFEPSYWREQYHWYYHGGGNEAVAEYLLSRDLSDFDPKAPPPKTAAFWEIVNANRAPEDAELMDVLDALGSPNVVTLDQVAGKAAELLQLEFADWLHDRKNARRVPHRFEDCNYVVVRNPHDTEGRWKISGKRHTIYGKTNLSERDRIAAANALTGAR